MRSTDEGVIDASPLRVVPKPAEREASRVEPHSLEAERAILGAILLGPEALRFVAERLERDPDRFYRPAHGAIFQAMLDVQARHGAVDMGLLTDYLRETGALKEAGGVTYLVQLAASVPAAANLPAHVELVAQRYRQRRVETEITRAREAVRDSENDPLAVVELLATATRKLAPASRGDTVDDYEAGPMELYDRHIGSHLGAEKPRFSVGIPAVDELLGPITPTSYVVIAGRSGVGKSIFGLQVARHNAKAGLPCLYFGLEMGRQQYFFRILSGMTGINTALMQSGKLTARQQQRLIDASAELEGMALRVVDEVMELGAILEFAERCARERPIGAVVVDTVHNIEHGRGDYVANRAVSHGLRQLARRLKIVVVSLAQYPNGKTEGNDRVRPSNDWLMGGAFMHQDASHVLHLHQPEGPNVEGDPRCEAVLGKNRDGKAGQTAMLARIPERQLFEQWVPTSKDGR